MDQTEHFSRGAICKECYWFMTSLNVMMESKELTGSEASGSDSEDENSNLRKTNLKKFLDLLPNSYDIFNSVGVKPKRVWPRILDILDR